MPDTYTAKLGLIKPEVGASRDSWGSKTNENWDDLDQFVSAAMPIGALLDFAGPTAPVGWLICDGRLVSRVTYSALFAVLGTFWGAGNGSTTFALPGQQGRASIGPGAFTDASGVSFEYSFAQRGGYVANSITKAHLPNYAMVSDGQGNHGHGGATAIGGSHSHTMDAKGEHTHSYMAVHNIAGPLGLSAGGNAAYGPAGTGVTSSGPHTHAISSSDNHTHGINTDGYHQHTVWLGGSSQSFTVQNPFIAVTKIIYAGRQALPATTALVEVPQRRISTPMRGSH